MAAKVKKKIICASWLPFFARRKKYPHLHSPCPFLYFNVPVQFIVYFPEELFQDVFQGHYPRHFPIFVTTTARWILCHLEFFEKLSSCLPSGMK